MPKADRSAMLSVLRAVASTWYPLSLSILARELPIPLDVPVISTVFRWDMLGVVDNALVEENVLMKAEKGTFIRV